MVIDEQSQFTGISTLTLCSYFLQLASEYSSAKQGLQ